MIKTKRYSIIAIFVIGALLFIINWVTPAQADKEGVTTPMATSISGIEPDGSKTNISTQEQKEINQVITDYFDIHFRVLSVSPPENF